MLLEEQNSQFEDNNINSSKANLIDQELNLTVFFFY